MRGRSTIAACALLCTAVFAHAQAPLSITAISKAPTEPPTELARLEGLIRSNCVSFVATEAAIDSLRVLTPGLPESVILAVRRACRRATVMANWKDVEGALAQPSSSRNVQSEIVAGLKACPVDGYSRKQMKAIARRGANGTVIAHVGRLCGHPVKRQGVSLAGSASYAPMVAAPQIRAGQLGYSGGQEFRVHAMWIQSAALQFGVEFVRTGYRYGTGSLTDSISDADFSLGSRAVVGRFTLTCMWQPCGANLVTAWDAFIDVLGTRNHMSGSASFANSNTATYSFKGYGLGARAGLVLHASRWLDLQGAYGHSHVWFDEATVIAPGLRRDKGVEGTSVRRGVQVSIALRLPPA